MFYFFYMEESKGEKFAFVSEWFRRKDMLKLRKI